MAVTTFRIKTARVSDDLNLTKPLTVLPHLVTAAAAMFLAAKGMPHPATLLFVLLGGGCLAAAANTLNCYLDRDIDALMERTRRRPLPAGLINPEHALAFGTGIGLAGVSILVRFVNMASAILAVAALLYYVFAYTLWLKRRTYWSSIIGSGIGLLPPLIGWISVADRISLTPFLLAAIVVFWTVPHFGALAVFRRGDYELAGIKIPPFIKHARWLLFSSMLTVLAGIALIPVAGMGWLYLASASLLGAGLLIRTLQFDRPEPLHGALNLYRYSVFYIAGLFGALILDRLILKGSGF